MPKNFLYFDLETQRSANDVGGWEHKDKMGMSVGVTYSSLTGKYTIYTEEEAGNLIKELAKADLVIGFNHVGFDYGVLQGYSTWDVDSQMRSLDIMLDLESKLGHKPKLEDVAMASIGTGKTAHGVEAIRWWREGRYRDVAEYCCFDVKVTRLVYEYGVRHGFVKYVDRFTREHTISVSWVGPE